MRNSPKQVFKGNWEKLSNAVHTTNITSILINTHSFVMKPDGTQIVVVHDSVVGVYDLAIPYDVSSHGAINSTIGISGILGIDIKPDGTQLFAFGIMDGFIAQFEMPTPWDPSSIILIDVMFGPIPITNDIQGTLSRDGEFIFLTTTTGDIYRFVLTIPYDITSIISNTFFTPGGATEAVKFKREGDKMYILDSIVKQITEYNLSTIWDLSTATPTGNVLDLSNLGTLLDFRFQSNGDELFILEDTDTIIKYHLDTSWDISTASYFSNIFVIGGQNRAITWRPDGTIFFILNRANNLITEYFPLSPWNLTNAVTGSSINVNTLVNENNANGMQWSLDGLHCFIIGRFNNVLFQLNAGTAWVVNTLTDSGISFAPVETNQTLGLFFRNDGLKFYLCESQAADMVFEYDMPAPYDIANAVYSGNNLVVTGTARNPSDMSFRSDGVIMYVLGSTDVIIARYVLSSPWNVSTGVFVDSLDISPEESSPLGIFVRSDGKKLNLSGNNSAITSYDL